MIIGLKDYLIESAKQGYASGDFKAWVKEKDGSTTITNTFGEFKMHDNFFGGEPYGGRELVVKNGKAVWIMVYYGKVISKNPDEVYVILRKALSQPDQELPIRGPRNLTEGKFKYQFKFSGNLEYFEAKETISLNEKEIYKAKFIGGEVDKRKGD